MQSYKLPDLLYDYDALEPVISSEIMKLHHQKHHATYVTKLNEALGMYYEAEQKRDLSTMIALESNIRFNGGGHINHSLFWKNLAPISKGGGGDPSGELSHIITKQFGSIEKFKDLFTTKTIAIQGSGWGWLGFCPVTHTVKITTCQNQDPLSTQGLIPLLGIDVWEHAYYLQYKNVRADYVKNIWKVIAWKEVEERFHKAKK